MSMRKSPQQRGAALIISLIILLLMTILGVTSMSSSIMEERMSGNNVDRQLAFQAAEAALRNAEAYVLAQNPLALDEDCAGGICTNKRYQTNIAWRTDPDHATWNTALEPAAADVPPGVALPPKYIIEDACPHTPEDTGILNSQRLFRITAIGYGGSATARVMLEASFITDNRYGTGSNCACGDPTYCTACPDITCTP